jgi:hypothetical protein
MSAKIICIRHPKYDGKSKPVLSCNMCCIISVEVYKENNPGVNLELDEYKRLNKNNKKNKR